MKKHYTVYVPGWIYDDLPVGTIEYDPTRNEAVLRREGRPERYFASVPAALNCVRQEHSNAYLDEGSTS